MLCKLCGKSPIELDINCRDTTFAQYYDTLQWLDNGSTFEYPYTVRLYNNGTYVKTLTNTVRPTKGLYYGLVFMNSGAPIFWNGTGWVDSTGTAV